MEMKKNEYKLSDLFLCGWLLVAGMVLIRTEQQKKNRIVFVLQDITERPALINQYYSGNAVVCPLAYKNKIGDLKSLIYSS